MALRIIDGGKAEVPEQIDEDIRPFRDYYEEYYAKGWIPLWLPPRKKKSPPLHTTGRYPVPDWKTIKQWASDCPEFANIAARMPAFAFGVDVDQYGEKHGLERLQEVCDEASVELPDTWVSSARTRGASGIRYYLLDDQPNRYLPSNLGGGIEIIRLNHRYAVLPPSIHEDFERHYRWYTPGQEINGNGTFDVPVLRAGGASQ